MNLLLTNKRSAGVAMALAAKKARHAIKQERQKKAPPPRERQKTKKNAPPKTRRKPEEARANQKGRAVYKQQPTAAVCH
jgi:hypothetical protein